MRSLWTASSGMRSQQFNVDVISNNLANVNTVSYKKDKVEFKDLLYQTMERAYMLDGEGKPVNLQVGHGSAVTSTAKNFSTGSFEQTENTMDFAIQGNAFFKVRGPGDKIMYTRDGSFKLSVTDSGNMLTTADGYPVLDENDSEILMDIDFDKINFSDYGEMSYTDEDGTVIPLGQTIGLVQFSNVQGLESIGGNFYLENSASGEALPDADQTERSVLRQSYLEASNVQVVEEMVKLIAAQRAYELNSKAIQTSDDMLGMANNLKR